MTEEITKENSLKYLLEEEEICREHVLDLQAKIPLYTSAFFFARRNGDAKTAESARIAGEKVKAEAAERRGHYQTHSNDLIAAIKRDLDYIAAEKMDEEYRLATSSLLDRAQAHRKAILK